MSMHERSNWRRALRWGLPWLALAVACAPSGIDEDRDRAEDTDRDGVEDTDDGGDTDGDVDTDEPAACDAPPPPAEPVRVTGCHRRMPLRTTLTEKWRAKLTARFLWSRDILVFQANDDNGDGRIGRGDIPDVALPLLGGLYTRGELLHGDTGGAHDTDLGLFGSWMLPVEVLEPGGSSWAWAGRPRRDDPEGYDAIVGVRTRGTHRDDQVRQPLPEVSDDDCVWKTRNYSARAPYQVADVDGDALGDLVLGFGWWSPANETGMVAPDEARGLPVPWAPPDRPGSWCQAHPVDLDGDAPAELVAGGVVVADDGSIHCDTGAAPGHTHPVDLDGDERIELLHFSREKIQVFDADCTLLRERTFEDLLGVIPDRTEFLPRVFPIADGRRVISFQPFGYADHPALNLPREVLIDGELERVVPADAEMLRAVWRPMYADVDGDGAYEVIGGPGHDDLLGPLRIREIDSGVVRGEIDKPGVRQTPWGWVDVDGDLRGELLVTELTARFDETGRFERYVEGNLVVYEVDGAAPAPRSALAQEYGPFRAGLRHEDGSLAPAGAYPPRSLYNTLNVQEYAPEVDGYDVELQARFVDVCTDECTDGRLLAWVVLENTGRTDMIHPAEVEVVAAVGGREIVRPIGRIERLDSGDRTEPFPVVLEGANAAATDLRARVRLEDRSLVVCPLEPVVWDGALCPFVD